VTSVAPGDQAEAGTADEPLTIDDLARKAGLPVRTIREYHTMRLVPPPERRGRVGLYGPEHVKRLELIARLQRRGYSLAGIRDLLGAWESGTDLTTVLGVDQGQAVLDETPLRLTRAELLERLPALADSLDRAGQAGLVRRADPDHFIVRSPALLGLAADWVRAGVPLAAVLDVIEALTRDLNALAGTLAGLIADRVLPSAATSAGDTSAGGTSAGELPGLLQRARSLLLQGVASTLADRLGAALAQRAAATGDSRLSAALDSVRIGAVTDADGTIHRSERQR
jgi:DNA-binding transcriptional MerR regulator